MAKTPDEDSWIEQIRCPRYFDFEAALTVPCPSGGETNPPLRDSVYESDDETRSFFHTLETDSSLHHTPHPQENSPPRPELRNVRPIYRHRPTTSFQQYLQNFQQSQANPSRESSRVNAPSTQQSSPCPPRKAPVTPRRNGQRKTSRISSRNATTSGGAIKNLASEYTSPPNSKPTKANPSTPPRRQTQLSEDVSRKSAPNESALLRRRRPPERVTPPISSVSSKSTSGGFGRNKSRKAIARSDDVEGPKGQIPCNGKRAPHVKFSPKKTERSPAEKENTNQRRTEPDLLDVDPEILRMMEEHNRRILQKKALSESNEGEHEVVPCKPNKIINRDHDQTDARHGRGITLRDGRTAADLETSPLREKTREGSVPEPAKPLLKKGEPVKSKDQQGSGQQGQRGVPDAGKQNRSGKNSLYTPPLPRSTATDEGLKSKSESRDDDASLDELLKSENERVLQERKKRLPERRRGLQVDKNLTLNSLERQRAEQDLPRTKAKVEFTSAKEKSRSGAAPLLEKDKQVQPTHRNRDKENKERDKLVGTKPRKRGLKGLRERSKIGTTPAVSSGLSKGPSHAQITRPKASTKLRQPYTDRIKAMERQKRLEKRLEEDLHELLSQHNSRVQGNRRVCSSDDQSEFL